MQIISLVNKKVWVAKTSTMAIHTKKRQQVTIHPDKDELENVKILAKVKYLNLNSMIHTLIMEAMVDEQYQKIIHAYIQIKETTL